MARTDNKNKELFLITFIRFAPIVIIPLITLLIVWILVYNANQNYEDMKAYEKEVYIEQKKNEAKREVDRFIEIAQTRLSIYNYKNVENIQKNLLTIASKIKFDISGYLIIGGMEGTMLYHPNKGLLNANLFDPQFEKEKNVYIQFKNKIDTQGKGFVKYHWTNPSSKKLEDKITYVRELPELNWYVAAGVYLDELEQHIEEKTKLNTLYDKNNLMIIAIASIILLLITIAISIGLSVFLRNIFREYRKNIILEIDKNKMIEASKKEFELLANTDSLTKIHNRFSIMKIMHNEHLYAQKNNLPLSVIMFDLDHFKDVNDHYGHDVGDDVLRDMAQVTKKHLRDNDEMGRYGGEEFIVVLPKTTIQTAKVIAERLRKEVELFEFSVVKNITISIGVIEVLKGEDEHQLFKRLDTLLYESKNKGRNRVSG